MNTAAELFLLKETNDNNYFTADVSEDYTSLKTDLVASKVYRRQVARQYYKWVRVRVRMAGKRI